MAENVFLWYMKIFGEIFVSIFMVFYYLVRSWIEFFYVSPKDLKGEIVFLTGAAGGFGSLISKKLAKRGEIYLS